MKAIECLLQKNTSHVFFEIPCTLYTGPEIFLLPNKEKKKTKEKQKIAIPLQFSSKITVSREIT